MSFTRSAEQAKLLKASLMMAEQVDCAMIIVQEGEVDIGGNPSAE